MNGQAVAATVATAGAGATTKRRGLVAALGSLGRRKAVEAVEPGDLQPERGGDHMPGEASTPAAGPDAAPSACNGRPAVLLILGLDGNGRPHASRFDGFEPAEIEAAAAAMEMVTLEVNGDPLAELAAKLPTGKLFASGKAFVPFVNGELYKRLVAYLPVGTRPEVRKKSAAGGTDAASNAGGSGGAGKRGAKANATASGAGSGSTNGDQPDGANAYAAAKGGKPSKGGIPVQDWDKVTVGSLVLASDGRADGWWTAIVTADKGSGTFVLRWEDFPDYDPIERRLDQLAMLPAAYTGK